MSQQVTVIATLHARPGQEAALEARMRIMIEATRKEAGCIRYDMHRAADDPASLIMVEYWTSAEALQQHDDSSHMAALGRDLPDLVDRPVEVRKFSQVA
ncbi:putative quinol monooxygenase [Massilia sp. YIM B02443]|uniref:putative quinol monooxygenase n=1 Tax=Massilia sp. YIM B02443 TaxID=3050127 RepID=UPI0025B69C4E|nr:putative quinol monooxygenase [Massilia sp. YIM B02443]MDN4039475.1 putative quinol monooxygenase [Massilia sp. YIM B02443]